MTAAATTSTAATPWIAWRKPNPHARLRLFCFPYAGTGAAIFRSWAEGLPADIEVCPVQLPGRANRTAEARFTRLGPLIPALAQGLAPLLDQPFAVFGHSLGALIGFELTRHLRQHYGLQPVRLLVSADRAPHRPRHEPPLHTLPDRPFLIELAHFNGIPAPVLADRELMQLLLPTLRADLTLYETYRYTAEAPLDCPISCFGGWQDHKVKVGDLEAWRDQTRATFSLRLFTGDHFFLNSAQTLLLQALSQDLHALA